MRQTQLGIDGARHLLVRTGFGASPDVVATWAGLSRGEAVEQVLDQVNETTDTPPPAWVDESPPERRVRERFSESERKDFRRKLWQRGAELKGWWMKEMLTSTAPFGERMTLFWHNHFTSSLRKVRWPPLMYRQNRLLRQHAMGNFGELLHAVARDPAMVVYLDSARNRKGHPNENFARELLELFTLGEGHYTEQDIKAAARAFTGWSVAPDSGEFRFRPRLHDGTRKQFLGVEGQLDGDDVIDILLRQPRTAEWVVEKLWRAFVSPTTDPSAVTRLAAVFRNGGYEMHPLMAEMLRSDEFFDPRVRGTLIKSPVDLLAGTVRTLEIPPKEGTGLAFAARRMGQDLLDPPSVKGWPGGTHWIDSARLLARQDALSRLLDGRQMLDLPRRGKTGPVMQYAARGLPAPEMDPFNDWLKSPSDGERLRKCLLALAPADPAPLPPNGSALVRRLIQDPVYQLM